MFDLEDEVLEEGLRQPGVGIEEEDQVSFRAVASEVPSTRDGRLAVEDRGGRLLGDVYGGISGAGVDDAAKVKGEYLAKVAQGALASPLISREKATELLERFGLEGRGRSYPDRLSGGQQQRVAFARSLMTDPEVLLLDEVTSALDPELVGDVLAIIRGLKAGGMTMMMASHEMQFCREVADQVCFLDAGRILERGSPAQVFTQPREARTREFLQRVLP